MLTKKSLKNILINRIIGIAVINMILYNTPEDLQEYKILCEEIDKTSKDVNNLVSEILNIPPIHLDLPNLEELFLEDQLEENLVVEQLLLEIEEMYI